MQQLEHDFVRAVVSFLEFMGEARFSIYTFMNIQYQIYIRKPDRAILEKSLVGLWATSIAFLIKYNHKLQILT